MRCIPCWRQDFWCCHQDGVPPLADSEKGSPSGYIAFERTGLNLRIYAIS